MAASSLLFVFPRAIALTGALAILNGLSPSALMAQSTDSSSDNSSTPITPVQSDLFGPTSVLGSGYRLGPGDVISVSVFAAEEYSGEQLVLQDGTVNLPRVGRVPIQGFTLEQAAEAIAARYAIYIHRPLVTIAPVRLRPVRIAISGEVNRPGAYSIEGSDRVNDNQGVDAFDSRFPTLTQAISEAGGITDQANLREIEIRRPVAPNRQEITRISLWDLIESGDLSQDAILQSGDEVYIPTATALTPQEATTLSSASFAPDTIRVYVAGEVEQPGVVEVPLNTPLNQAILVAGSFTPRANQNTVELVRLNPDGTATERDIPVDFSQGVNDTNNPILKDQDVIVISRSGAAQAGDTTNIILNPITRILGALFGFGRLFD
ncbi:polysaccharide transporter [filamentous cyanobacterium CCP5]|nr:polysaccharide transporter [filamentous cyanobacterium CCP5]